MVQKPNYRKTILCLANSRRPRGTCVAGKEFVDGKIGEWVRPVNSQNENAISPADRRYENGDAADVLDVVSIPMIGPLPQGHQTENHQIDPKFYWVKRSRATWVDVVNATDKVQGPLWVNGDPSFHGLNDKVAEMLTNDITNSLLLIEPKNLAVIVGDESQFGGGVRRRVRASFELNGFHYNFVITDPFIEDEYLAGQNGKFPIGESRICVSLPEVLNGSATKLVAAVFTPEMIG
jgi:hypothetical protein